MPFFEDYTLVILFAEAAVDRDNSIGSPGTKARIGELVVAAWTIVEKASCSVLQATSACDCCCYYVWFLARVSLGIV